MKNKKFPKLSTAIIKGIEKYPKQAYNIWVSYEGDEACVLGGVLGAYQLWPSIFYTHEPWVQAEIKFQEEYGIAITAANDEGLDRETIAGMLIAINE